MASGKLGEHARCCLILGVSMDCELHAILKHTEGDLDMLPVNFTWGFKAEFNQSYPDPPSNEPLKRALGPNATVFSSRS